MKIVAFDLGKDIEIEKITLEEITLKVKELLKGTEIQDLPVEYRNIGFKFNDKLEQEEIYSLFNDEIKEFQKDEENTLHLLGGVRTPSSNVHFLIPGVGHVRDLPNILS